MMRKTVLILLLIVCFNLILCTDPPQPESAWREIEQDRANMPTYPIYSKIVYIGDNKFIKIGGAMEDSTTVLDMWEYDMEIDEWSPITFDGAVPLEDIPYGRYGHSLAFDEDHTIVLFGGYFYPAPNTGEPTPYKAKTTWEFDTNTYTWSKYAYEEDDPRPGRKIGGNVWGQMVYIGESKFIQFGGNGLEYMNEHGDYLTNETWEYDSSTHTWREIYVNGTPPQKGSSHNGLRQKR